MKRIAAIVGIVTPSILIANTCGIEGADRTLLIQVSLLITALATLIQLFPIGPVGSRLPVIMGISFAYVPSMQAIAFSGGGVSAIACWPSAVSSACPPF